MWHFHQLLRMQLQVASTTMKRVRVPSELVASSVKLVGAPEAQGLSLSVEVKSTTKCIVQVFWDVKASALEGTCPGANSAVDGPRKRRLQVVDAALPTRAARTAIHAVRSLPGKLYDMDGMYSPHRLLDEETGKDDGYTGDGVLSPPKAERTGLCLARFLGGSDAFRACSVMERYEWLSFVYRVLQNSRGFELLPEDKTVVSMRTWLRFLAMLLRVLVQRKPSRPPLWRRIATVSAHRCQAHQVGTAHGTRAWSPSRLPPSLRAQQWPSLLWAWACDGGRPAAKSSTQRRRTLCVSAWQSTSSQRQPHRTERL
jgi:hypothetical protein